MKQQLYIVKIGGNIIDDETKLSLFLADFSRIDGHKILVHGGGKLATRLGEQLQIPQVLVEGRRITDAETLKIVTMVYAGYINKNIVAGLQSYGCNAIGITGADGNAILAHKRVLAQTDFGFAGDIDLVNIPFISDLLAGNMTIVMAPITHDGKGQLLNTNADTIAQEMAKELGRHFQVTLIYSFEKSGVLLDANDDTTVIAKLSPGYYRQLKATEKIFAGMIPKLDNAFTALNSGVQKVIIGNAGKLDQLITGESGTTIVNE